MADCEGKACYTKIYKTQNVKVVSVNAVPVINLTPATKVAAAAAIKAKAETPKEVKCDEECECVDNNVADTNWSVWKEREVHTKMPLGGANVPVIGTVDRAFKKTEQGDCEDPNELKAYRPGEWDSGGSLASRKGKRGGRNKA